MHNVIQSYDIGRDALAAVFHTQKNMCTCRNVSLEDNTAHNIKDIKINYQP